MLNSTCLGSTITNFNSAGCFLYSKEVIIAFKPTDLPCPVVKIKGVGAQQVVEVLKSVYLR